MIRWEANLDERPKHGGIMIDRRCTNSYGTMNGQTSNARTLLEPAWTFGDPDRIPSALVEFICGFREDDLHPNTYVRGGVTVADVTEWLFEV